MATATSKRRKINKSAAVREYLHSNPTATGAEVVEALRAKKIKVSPNYISIIRSQAKKGRKSNAKPQGYDDLMAAVSFVRVTGSVAAAREVLNVLEKVRE